MKKLMISFTMTALIGSLVGCVGGDGEGDEATAEEASALSVGGHYCVNQSFASARRDVPFLCNTFGGPGFYDATLSNGHPVKILANCVDRTYVYVQSRWTGSQFMMRGDAFRPC